METYTIGADKDKIKEIKRIRSLNKNKWFTLIIRSQSSNLYKLKIFNTYIQVCRKYDKENNFLYNIPFGTDMKVKQFNEAIKESII